MVGWIEERCGTWRRAVSGQRASKQRTACTRGGEVPWGRQDGAREGREVSVVSVGERGLEVRTTPEANTQ